MSLSRSRSQLQRDRLGHCVCDPHPSATPTLPRPPRTPLAQPGFPAGPRTPSLCPPSLPRRLHGDPSKTQEPCEDSHALETTHGAGRPLSPATLSLPDALMNEVAAVAGTEVTLGLSNTHFCSPRPTWLRPALSAHSASSRRPRRAPAWHQSPGRLASYLVAG